MEKEQLLTYKGNEKLSFLEATLSMINCRNYLAEAGFESRYGFIYSGNSHEFFQDCWGKITFPDSSAVTQENFRNLGSIDNLIINIIESSVVRFDRKIKLIETGINHLDGKKVILKNIFGRKEILKTTMIKENIKENYSAEFLVEDTTLIGRVYGFRSLVSSPNKLAITCRLKLEKSVIESNDREKFDRIVEGLNEAISKKEASYENLIPQTNTAEKTEEEDEEKKPEVEPPRNIEFIDPWGIDIAKIK